MATIEEVVKEWDKNHKNNPTETLTGKNVQPGGKIDSGTMFGRPSKWAIIKLSNVYTKWNKQIYYAFDFKSGKPPEINFQKRSGYPCDTEKLYEFLDTNFNGIVINGKKLTLDRGRINPNNLILSINFDRDSPAEKICVCMEELIKLTKDPICKFLESKDKEEPPAESEEIFFTESDENLFKEHEEIFSEIMDKHKIKKDENNKLYNRCKKIYIQTLKILDILYIGSKNAKDFLKVAYYTQKNIAQKLLIASKDDNKYGEFRLYYTHGMNDPHEGKTLLQFLEIENEDLKLPEPLPFIACFSFEVDSLNQFRLYGKDNNEEATGVSIAFDLDFFNKGTNKEQEKYRLYRCVYIDTYEEEDDNDSYEEDDEEEDTYEEKISVSYSKKEENKDKVEVESNQINVSRFFKKLKEEIQNFKKETQKELEIKDININKTELAKDLIIKIRYLVKDDAFMEERECRIIDTTSKRNRKNKSINIEGERLYITIGGIKKYVDEIYFAPLTEGMEVFQIETGIKCIRSRRPYKSKRQ